MIAVWATEDMDAEEDEDAWAQETLDKIDAFTERWPDSEYGPGHIAISDYNLLDSDIRSCLNWTRAALQRDDRATVDPALVLNLDKLGWYDNHSVEELKATVAFLAELLAIPEDER